MPRILGENMNWLVLAFGIFLSCLTYFAGYQHGSKDMLDELEHKELLDEQKAEEWMNLN
jgi:hypothetical protein